MAETECDKLRDKWYYKTRTMVVAFLLLGPLALPLLWAHPRYRVTVKVAWTVVFVVLTIVTWQATVSAVKSLSVYYSEIF